MSPRTPRHLAERRLPLRLMLVAFGLTFAVLAAMVAAAALVPGERLVPRAAPPITTAAGAPGTATDPAPPVAPTSAAAAEPATTGPEPPPGEAPIRLAAQAPPTTAPQGTTGTTGPTATDPPDPTSPATTEPEPAPVTTVAPTTTTLDPTTTTAEPTTTVDPTTTTAEPTTTTEPVTTTTLLAVTLAAGEQAASGALLAPLLGLLYLLRGLLPGPAGRHARPGRYRLGSAPRPRTRRPPG